MLVPLLAWVYTGITRAKRLLVVVGQKKDLDLAVRNDQACKRYSGLLSSLKKTGRWWRICT
jgi:ATP-dependent exoDNAse (exonuclease V) alpha subunit